jgi:ketosteroid isomerase-like protein
VSHSESIERYIQALNARDWAALAPLLEADILYEVPQTRERVRGQDPYIDFNRTFPGNWSLKIERLVVDSTRGVAELTSRVDGEVSTAVVFFEFNEHRIARITDYWPQRYEPPARLSRFIERY